MINEERESKKKLIQQQKLFNKLTPAEMDQLADLFTTVHLNAGDTIVKEGGPVDSVFLILEGTADVRHIRFNDARVAEIQSVATLQPGQSIGLSETGFYSLSGVRTATVVANTKMVLYRLSVAAFNGFALANTHVHEVMHPQET